MNVDALYGLTNLSFWGYVLAAFVMIQFTFMGVTLYLHRDATHRSLDLHPALRHVFRFWLWMSSGMLTGEWVAVHRKHHARCETIEDPHSPAILGLRKVLFQGAELYTQAARSPGLVEKYGRGTPDDWIERNVYRRFRAWGIVLMVLVDLLLFGVPGIIIIAAQMLAIPFVAAGVVNGLGHFSGYRNFESPDAARNIMPWGLVMAGEELHNNHHAFPSSAKFSVRAWEFDLGWLYICILRSLGLAHVRRVAPRLSQGSARTTIDIENVRAALINRMHLLRMYGHDVTKPLCRKELQDAGRRRIREASRLLVREPLLLDCDARQRLRALLASSPTLTTVYEFRERLNQLWNGAARSNEMLLRRFRVWIEDAEASGLPTLQRYALTIRSAGVAS